MGDIMSAHILECELTEPCGKDTPDHGFCSRQRTYCIHCERACICDRLRACEKRMLDAAREAVKSIPAHYKIRWDYSTYGSYWKGKADLKDAALTVINALIETR